MGWPGGSSIKEQGQSFWWAGHALFLDKGSNYTCVLDL